MQTQTIPPVATRSAIQNLPQPRNTHFSGRTRVIDMLRGSLGAEGRAIRTYAICGSGGTGKTQLALEYAYRYQQDYRLIWWVEADEPSTLALHYAALGQRLGVESSPLLSPEQTRAAVRQELEKRGDFLLVFDNALGPDSVREYLPKNAGHVLITSRQPNWGSVARSFWLRVFDRSESVEFLLSRTGRPMTAAASTLAQALGDLPLALEQAAALIEQTGITFSEYLRRFEEHWAELLQSGRSAGEYPDTIAMTWELACRQVEQENSDESALLKILAYLAPAPIPIRLLRRAGEKLPVPLCSRFRTALGLDEAIGTLRRFALVGGNDHAIFVHRLVGSLTRDRLPKAQQHNWCEVALGMMEQTFQFDAGLPAKWSDCGEALPHALAASAHAEAAGLAPETTARLLNQVGEYLLQAGQFEQARSALERALALNDTVHGQQDPRRSSIVNNLGRVLKRLGDNRQALACFENALILDQTAYGQTHPHVAEVVNNYGTVLHLTGDIQTALAQFEWALDICREHYGADHPKVATVTNNIGYALASAGDLAKAQEHFTRALQIAEAACGPEHPLSSSIRTNLGIALRLKGDMDAARAQLERAVSNSEAVLGPGHVDVARGLAQLALLHQNTGDFQTARRYFQRALEIDERALGPTNVMLIARLNDLGRCLKQAGDIEAATACSERAAGILRGLRTETEQ